MPKSSPKLSPRRAINNVTNKETLMNKQNRAENLTSMDAITRLKLLESWTEIPAREAMSCLTKKLDSLEIK